ncbi:hypothetical protein GQ600_15465 [Phytophthora cactorum]|nr:hypothetical protein GQ600_15465 [Phytophthora cactorum]
MDYQSLQENKFIGEVYKNVNVQHDAYNGEMTLVANIVRCPHVYFMKSVCANENALDALHEQYSISTRNWTCTVFAHEHSASVVQTCVLLRKALGKETVIPTQLLNRWWLISTVRSAVLFEQTNETFLSPEAFAMNSVLTTEERPWTQVESTARHCRLLLRFGMRWQAWRVARRFKRCDFSNNEGEETVVTSADSPELHLDMIHSQNRHCLRHNNNASAPNVVLGPPPATPSPSRAIRVLSWVNWVSWCSRVTRVTRATKLRSATDANDGQFRLVGDRVNDAVTRTIADANDARLVAPNRDDEQTIWPMAAYETEESGTEPGERSLACALKEPASGEDKGPMSCTEPESSQFQSCSARRKQPLLGPATMNNEDRGRQKTLAAWTAEIDIGRTKQGPVDALGPSIKRTDGERGQSVWHERHGEVRRGTAQS